MKKSFSFLTTICIVSLLFVNCQSSSLLSIDEASAKSGEEESLVLHTPTKVFSVDNFNFSDDKLLGDLKVKRKHKGYTIHVYSDLDYKFNLQENQVETMNLSNSHIQKITYTKKTPGKAIGIGVGVTAVLLGVLYYIGMSSITY